MLNDKSIVIKSNAKVNLTLRITGVLPNGYHTISSLFQEIDLHDELHFSPTDQFQLTCSDPKLPTDSTNLCFKAYEAMRPVAKVSSEWHIHLIKNIPTGAGLGGGSSNAATVLKFLNQNWEANLPDSTLVQIAVGLGSDVPFYLRGKAQIANGVGEILTPVKLPESFVILLVCPPISISTAWAYREFDLVNCKKEYKFDSLFDEKRVFWTLFENQFESVVFPSYPEIGAIREEMKREPVLYAGLSGSGSTVFGIFRNETEAATAQKRFQNYPTFLTLPKF
ncbi:MAG: 4-(cytidine 5'-diphospho)-2-C-methyl-D-erythritol kinase [Candidatus Marinimicrobia bacterium CG08_land_8_20_14_0_20_45_22]|nr:MAG: 4-(cytidine 5'-diphospho)-2-C-methyl-D-erythritol kinase [Candidatus Marinimicrobia bacterium CG08_land_8_20_14_0_20_45_22]